MKKALLWVRILSAGAAVCAVAATAASVMMTASAAYEPLPMRMILSWAFAPVPPILLLIYALAGYPKRPHHPLLAAAAVAAAIPCAVSLWDRIGELAGRMDRTAPPRGAVGVLGWAIQGAALLVQLAGLVFFLWMAADGFRRLKGLKTSRVLGSVYAGMQGIRCIVYIWETVVSLTDSRAAAADAVPSGLLLASNLSGILTILCFAAAWTVLVWGGLRRDDRE